MSYGRVSSIGARRTPVQIQAQIETPDALGQLQPAWTTIATVWCLKRQLSGREVLNAQQLKAVPEFLLETWYLPSLVITELHQVVISGAIYGIARVDNLDDRNETLHLYCTKRTP